MDHLLAMAQNLTDAGTNANLFAQEGGPLLHQHQILAQLLAGQQAIVQNQQQTNDLLAALHTSAHFNAWRLYELQVETRNSINKERVTAARVHPRFVNHTRVHDHEQLEPLCLSIQDHPAVIVPNPPPLGQPAIDPPQLPALEELLGAHPMFPATRLALKNLTRAQLGTLLVAYGLVPPHTLDARREMFSQFIDLQL
ncbi:hypothetical protein DL93DRAFT_2071591 [Clavulina sp. PMI_390]|nr:hypothetical protein DL93DRAFT_2071591 [Clavulina sp. PMI_390]